MMYAMKIAESRSNCPIGKTLDIVGDKWSLLVLRHMIFAGSTTYKELAQLPENIATNILAERLERLVNADIIRKLPDPSDGRKSIYKITEKGLDLMPVLQAMIDWGMKHYTEASYPKELVDNAWSNLENLYAEARKL
jgi:DNA-binding HxlR family transcriptional regulator